MTEEVDPVKECLTEIAQRIEPLQRAKIQTPAVRELYMNADEHVYSDEKDTFQPVDIAKLTLLDIKGALSELDEVVFDPDRVLARSVFDENSLGLWCKNLLELQSFLLQAQEKLQAFIESVDV